MATIIERMRAQWETLCCRSRTSCKEAGDTLSKGRENLGCWWKANNKEFWRFVVRALLIFWGICCLLGGPITGTIFMIVYGAYLVIPLMVMAAILLVLAAAYMAWVFYIVPTYKPAVWFVLGLDKCENEKKKS